MSDTRQQAVEAAAELRATIVEMMSWAETMDLGRVGAEWADNKLAGYEVAAALASSPALPEPPAPTGRDSAGAYWNVAHGGKVDVLLLPEDDAHRGFVELADSKSNRAYTPYEARQLASTLLAAADVAEEGKSDD